MLAHSLNKILALVPEALEFVKQASIEEEFPLNNKDSCIASALQLKYFEKIAYHSVDFVDMEKVARAVYIYGVGNIVSQLSDKMVKVANSIENTVKIDYHTKEASFDTITSETAIELYKQAQEEGIEPSERVTRLSGNAYFSKEAAVRSLSVRFDLTKNNTFVKIAKALIEDTRELDSGDLVKIASFVDAEDKKYHLEVKGFDFFKEAFITKEAGIGQMTVRLAGKDHPYSSFQRLGRDHICNYIGEDLAQEFDKGPQQFKTVAETLPLDLQHVLINLTKNV